MKTAYQLIESVVNGYQSPADIFRDLVYNGGGWPDDGSLIEHSRRLLNEDTGGDIALPKMPSANDQLINRMGGKLPDDDDPEEIENNIEVTIEDPEDEAEYNELFSALDAAGIEYDTTFGDDKHTIIITWPEKEKDKIDKVLQAMGYEIEALEPKSAPDDVTYRS